MEYTSLQQIKKDIKDKNSDIYKTENFYFKGFDCWWADEDMDRLRCDPSTDKQYEDFYRLRKHLEPKIIVDLS